MSNYHFHRIVIATFASLFFYSQVCAQSSLPSTSNSSPTDAHTSAPENQVRILIVGDSTVRRYDPPRPERGWGQYIEEYFKDGTVNVINRAQAGRSTKTFISQGWWQKGIAEKPNYVLIQFGHNDSHTPDRHEATDAATEYKDNLRRYIDESRAIEATPILTTPMVQRTFDAEGKLHDDLQRYADAMKEVGAEKKVPVIDLHGTSKKLVEALGPQKSQEMASKKTDNTHFNEKGARAMADLVMKELPIAAPKLKDLLKAH